MIKIRRTTALLLIVISLISLSACGKSENAQAVDDLILAIGEVSNEHFDPDAIVAAQNAYEALTDAERDTLEHSDKLENARDEVFRLLNSSVEEAFNAGNTETAYTAIVGMIQYGFRFTDEQLGELQQYVTLIENICYAGTFVVMPDALVSEKPPKDIVARSLSWLKGTNMAPYFMYEYGDEGSIVWKRYLQYLGSVFELIDSGSFSYSGSDTEYYKFIDSRNNTIYASCETSTSWRGSESTITVELTGIDTTRLDLSKQETATHRDIDDILIRTDLKTIS